MTARPDTGRRPRPGPCRPLLVALALFSLGVHSPGVRAQLEEEDLPPSSLAQELPLDEVRVLFDQAEATFRSARQPESIGPLTEVIELLGEREEEGELPSEGEEMLLRSLSYRAQAAFNLGDDEATRQDLRRLVRRDPSYEMDPQLVSPKLLSLLKEIRSELVGRVAVAVTPTDARVLVNGEEREGAADGIPVLAGAHRLRISRPGYGTVEMEVEVAPGREVEREVRLERESAVVAVVTRPPGAVVEVDGEVAGTTSGADPEGWELTGPAAALSREELSDPLPIDGVEVGEHVLTVGKEGYRSQRLRVEVAERSDYRLAPVLLEPTAGTAVLLGAPADAEVRVDGEVVAGEGRPEGRELTVEPGRRRLTVLHRGLVSEEMVEVSDRQRIEVEVELRPGVVLLGVLGADTEAAGDLHEALTGALKGLEGWALLDRRHQLREVMGATGLRLDPLRETAQAGRPASAAADWPRAQVAADRLLPGSLRLLAVLSDDLVATHADLWLWPAEPSPPLPARVRVPVADPGALEQVARQLARPTVLERPWLGALLVDSETVAGPVVAAVNAEGPASAAGLAAGDVVLAVGGVEVATVEEAWARWEAVGVGAAVSVRRRQGGEVGDVELTLGRSPLVFGLTEPDALYPALGALVAGGTTGPAAPSEWVRGLNLAAVLLHGRAWEEAVRVLRGLEAPDRSGLGRAAVDYWLGVALAEAGASYREAAREALERASASSEGRLFHHDGPWTAPRARARLWALGGD